METSNAQRLIAASRQLCEAVEALEFDAPVTHVYNPLRYARQPHEAYLSLVGDAPSVVFLGMNPGPWGMAQTGVPFGEIEAVRDWLKIRCPVDHPADEHPKRPIEGFDCQRSEVSGRRLWGLFKERSRTAKQFFKRHFVLNYCPLVFMEASGRNRTPDKLPIAERAALDAACDAHLQAVLGVLQPRHAVGVGVYAENCLQRAVAEIDSPATVSRILHPSPASPAANRGWAEKATEQLRDSGVWK
ncbi:single-strand selective monofunctional uracil-DNA glycosylase [Roseiconus nitratireducens]|uniref:Single-strand selective monofunctional uracil-DNA glycosylase n=1 Tax=Roseiconus nitratireducens TaxID=2605748 RepID=A0A5M6D0D6_9BACT|nr:uracil-DNA glycosylase family protein [Roseiconus nitratireducens]KAA5540941.1 single-strand selective monofunctional uracil-DNA glycosylase [Roseiconus nitratireducens]